MTVSLKKGARWHSDLLVFLQGHAGFCSILSLNEDQLVSLDVLQDTLKIDMEKNYITGLLMFQLQKRSKAITLYNN